MSKSLLRLAILSAPLVLTACGEGWEAQRTSNYAPYGNSRTAGSGVAYVRARMLPKKELVAEPVMEEIQAQPVEEVAAEEVKPMEEPEPVLEAEEIFTEAQQKGVAPKVKAEEDKEAAAEKIEDTASTASVSEVKEEAKAVKAAAQQGAQKGVLTPMPELDDESGRSDEENHSSVMQNSDSEKMTAEDYISQAPKRIVTPKVEVIKMNSYEPASGEANMKTAGVDSSDIEEEIVEVYENKVVQPRKQIIVPKKDPGSYMSVGEEELHEIYNQPF